MTITIYWKERAFEVVTVTTIMTLPKDKESQLGALQLMVVPDGKTRPVPLVVPLHLVHGVGIAP